MSKSANVVFEVGPHSARPCMEGVLAVYDMIHITNYGLFTFRLKYLVIELMLMPLLKFCIFQDDSNTTCETLPGDDSRHVEVIWTFPSHPSSFNQFRVVISGSQPCHSINTSWFVRGDVPTGVPSECTVQEIQNENLRTCALTCECVDPSNCGYLHYLVQFPPWVSTTLALCHYELTTPYPGVVNPELVIYWCVLAPMLYFTRSLITHYLSSVSRCDNGSEYPQVQGWSWLCAKPMLDGITL